MAAIAEPLSFKPKAKPRCNEARVWLEKCVSGDIPKEISVKHSSNVERLAAIIGELVENWELARAILEICGLHDKESEKCLQYLISELKFYSQDHWPYLSDPSECTIGPTKIEWFCPPLEGADIPLCGRIFGPLLRLSRVPANVTATPQFFPFWLYFSSICVKHEFPLMVSEEKSAADGSKKSVGCNPFLIFETADLFSAVQNVIENTWAYDGKAHWSPTHVFVQESKFDELVNLLNFDALNFVKLTGSDSKETAEELNYQTFNGHLKVLQPSKYKKNFKFFIGWDPQLLNQEIESGVGVAVLPFRTVDEGVKAVNSLAAECVSIWTENTKLKSTVSSLLKMKTVWVNCHGILDSNTPFGEGRDEIPMNGPELFEWLSLRRNDISDPNVYSLNWDTKSGLLEFVVKDIAAIFGRSPPFSWPLPLKYYERVSALRPLQVLLQDVRGFSTGLSPSPSRTHTNSLGLEVTSTLLPYNWIIVKVPSTVGESVHDDIACLAAIYYGILYGCRVILYGTGKSLSCIQCYSQLRKLAKSELLAVVDSSQPVSRDLLKKNRCKLIALSTEGTNEAGGNYVTVIPTNYSLFPFLQNLFTSSRNVLIW